MSRLERFATPIRLFGIGCLLLAVALIVIQQGSSLSHVSAELVPQKIIGGDRNSYSYVLDDIQSQFPGLRSLSDDPRRPFRSNLRIRQDGVEFGIAHSQHADIASTGLGRYSHWGNRLYFSTPDNTDPRANGHSYQVSLNFQFPTWLVLSLIVVGGALTSSTLRPSGKFRNTSVAWADIWCICSLLVLAGFQAWLLLTENGYPAIVASTDGGNISAWVAGRIHPDRFSSDFLLSNPSNTSFYISFFMMSVAGLSRILGDVGQAYLSLSFPIVALQLIGFYLLGRMLTGSRFASIVLALLVNVPIVIWGYNDIFGTYFVPLTRTAYDAILPFLVMAFLRFGNRSRNIALLCVLCGLSIYVHPVSAPAVTAGLLLASFALKPKDETIRGRIACSFVGGLFFVVAALPFAWPFFGSFSGGLKAASDIQDPVLTAALDSFRKGNGELFYNALLALQMLLKDLVRTWPVWLIGFVGLIFIPLRDPSKSRACRFLLLFLAGCLLGSVGICLVDQTITRSLGRPPFQLDLIRGLRFVLVPLLMGFVLVLAEAEIAIRRRVHPFAVNFTAGAVAVAIVLSWWSAYPNRFGGFLNLAQIPDWARSPGRDASAMMDYLKNKPIDGTILPIGNATVGLAVRYAGLQPVAFISNDANALFYSGSDRRVDWFRLEQLRGDLDKAGSEGLPAFKRLWERSGASYLLLETSILNPSVEAQILDKSNVVKRFGRWVFVRPFTQLQMSQ